MTDDLDRSGRPADLLLTLEARVRERAGADPAQSWTARLMTAGPERCARKLGEEAVEAVLAVAAGSREAVIGEAADVLYHLCVALAVRGVSVAEVGEELTRRQAQSGLAEKASRSDPGQPDRP